MENPVLCRSFIWLWIVSLWMSGWVSISAVQAAQPTDDFIEGYATAIVTMSFPGNVESDQR